jgi:hypothetical protein
MKGCRRSAPLVDVFQLQICDLLRQAMKSLPVKLALGKPVFQRGDDSFIVHVDADIIRLYGER